MKLSATIITLNEQNNIARALESVDFADEIIVIDSGSIDNTIKIAESFGARVIHNKFEGYGQQKNFAAQQASHEWILSIDADEEIDSILRESIKDTLNNPQQVMFQVNRRTNYRGKWIYHGGWYPDHLTRLYKKSKSSWSEPLVHEELITKEVQNKSLPLPGHLNHYSFPTYQSQVDINVKYAKLGAKTLLEKKGRKPYLTETLFRPVIKFIECYFLKLGFLDGKEGLMIALNASYSMFMKHMFTHDQDKND